MPSFLAKIDEFNRIFLKESSNNQAEAATKDLMNLLNGSVTIKQSENDPSVLHIGSDVTSDYITIKVIGYKDTIPQEDANVETPERVLPDTPVEESEEAPIDPDISRQPNVIAAQQKVNQEQKNLAQNQLTAAQRVVQKLNSMKQGSTTNIR